MQGISKIVLKQRITIESLELIKESENIDISYIMKELENRQDEVVSSVKETFNAPETISVVFEESENLPVVTYRITVEDGSQTFEHLIEKMRQLHCQLESVANPFDRYVSLLKRLTCASSLKIRVTRARKRTLA